MNNINYYEYQLCKHVTVNYLCVCWIFGIGGEEFGWGEAAKRSADAAQPFGKKSARSDDGRVRSGQRAVWDTVRAFIASFMGLKQLETNFG